MLNQNRSIRNLELRIVYTGTQFSGWQIQPHGRTVQGVLNEVLGAILNGPPPRTAGASRTDAGVHAHDQHVSFLLDHAIPTNGLHRALNHRLPPEIRVLEVREQNLDYSARYHARAKHYGYLLFDGKNASPFLAPYFWEVPGELNVDAMDQAARCLPGTQSFKALQSARDWRTNCRTTIYKTRVSRRGHLICFDVVGRNFLYHMVRNMIGALMKVGSGEWTLAQWRERLRSGQRARMGVTAPGKGLHLFKVYYGDGPFVISETSRRFCDRLVAP